MQRVSVSTLETFRRYLTEASSFDTEEALINTLKGLFVGNDKTRFGSAYHKIIEGDFSVTSGQVYTSFKEKGTTQAFVFTRDQAEPALRFRSMHPLLVHEMSLTKVYETAYFPIQLTGRVDGIEGMVIRDAKTKFRTPDMRDYLQSCQWKFYCDMLGVDTFAYDIFEVQGFKDLSSKTPCHIAQDVRILYHEPILCNRYDDMTDEITTLLHDFIGFLLNRKLVHLLKPAIEETPFNF